MKVKFSELKRGDIFFFNGYWMKKNKDGTAIFIDESGKHLAWTHMGYDDMCEVVVKETK